MEKIVMEKSRWDKIIDEKVFTDSALYVFLAADEEIKRLNEEVRTLKSRIEPLEEFWKNRDPVRHEVVDPILLSIEEIEEYTHKCESTSSLNESLKGIVTILQDRLKRIESLRYDISQIESLRLAKRQAG